MSYRSDNQRPGIRAGTILFPRNNMNPRSSALRPHRTTMLFRVVLLVGLVAVLLQGVTVSVALSSAAPALGLNASTVLSPLDSNRLASPMLSRGAQQPPNGLIFVENVGQFEEEVLFAVQTRRGTLFLGQDALWMVVIETPQDLLHNAGDLPPGFEPDRTLQGTSLRMTFPDANPTAQIVPFDAIESSISYLKGSDPAEWVIEAPAWAGVRYEGLYPGLDLVISSEKGNWTWSLQPGIQPTLRMAPFALQAEGEEPHIQMRIEGAEALYLESAAVRAETVLGDLVVPLLDAAAAEGNTLVPEDARPALERDQVVDPFQHTSEPDAISSLTGPTKLSSPSRNPLSLITGSLLSGPMAEARPDDLVFSTYLGSPGGHNWAFAIDVDAFGAMYLGGGVFSPGLPTTPGAFQPASGGIDGYAAKFSPDASTLEYATYIAGSAQDEVRGIAVGEDGSVVMIGRTTSGDFPVTAGAFDTTFEGGDAFVLRLNAAGTGLVYSTFLGGSAGEEGMDVAVDSSNAAYVTGHTTSTDFPVTPGAPQGEFGGGFFDGFVAKLTPDGTALNYATYLGGSGTDCEIGGIKMECAIAIDSFGSAYIGGPTYSPDFPVTPGVFQQESTGGGDTFIAKVSPVGDAFEFATYIGGSGQECENACDITVDSYGASYLVGSTTSDDFPTSPGAWDEDFNGDWDGFAVKLSPDGSRLLYGTYLGGAGADIIWTGAATRAGELFISGNTSSGDFPTTPAGAQSCASCPDNPDGFLALLGVDGSLSYSSFIGGSRTEATHALALDSSDHAFLAGGTQSDDFPTTPGVYQPNYLGQYSSFAARLDVPTVDPPIIDLAGSTVEVVPPAIPANDFIGAAVLVTLIDTQGNPVVGHPVEVFSTGSQVMINPSTATTDASGKAQVEARSIIAQDVLITARDGLSGADLFDTATLAFVAGPTDPDQSTLIAEPLVVAADGIMPTVVTTTLLDAYANPVVGHEIIFFHTGFGIVLQTDSYVSDENGEVVVEARANYPQLVTFNARDAIDDVTLNASAQVEYISTDPDHSTIASDKSVVTADGIDFATLTVTFLDQLDQPVSGHGVVLRIDDAAGISVDMPEPITDENGQVTARVSSTIPKQVSIGAGDLVIEEDINATVTIEFLQTDPDLSTAVLSTEEAVADGVDEAILTVTLLYPSGAPVAGHEVSVQVEPYSDVSIDGEAATVEPFLLESSTDENGVVTATLQSTRTGLKTLTVTDATIDVTLTVQPQLEFIAGQPDPDQSILHALSGLAPADGTTQVELVVTARDAFSNNISGATVTLIASGDAILSQPTALTDENGQTSGFVADATVEMVDVRATIDGILIDDTASIGFRGADLAITKSARALSNYNGLSDSYALAGGTITYTLELLNEGLLPAEWVEVVDVLPVGLTFSVDASQYEPVVHGQTITWPVGTLPVDETATIEFEALIGGSVLGSVQNNANASTTGDEDDLSDNADTLETTIEPPRPVMSLSPGRSTLTVSQGGTNAIEARLGNSGAGEMTGITITSPPHIPWVSVEATGLDSLLPRTDATFAVIASTQIDTTPGSYRDFVTVSDDYGNVKQIALTVDVFAPQRDLALNIQNDQGQLVANAQVQLIRQQVSHIVTEGVIQTYNETVSGRSDASGNLTFPLLQVGAYDYTVIATDHDHANGEITIIEGASPQAETITLHARGRIGLSPSSRTIGVLPGTVASAEITITNLGQAPLTGLVIQGPGSLPWVTIAAAVPLPDLVPGGSLSFSVLASPPEGLTIDIFQDTVTVTADGGQSAQAALTIELVSELTRDARVNVVDDFDAPVAGGGEVLLVQQEPTELQLPSGEIRTFNQHYSQPITGGGTALFSGLDPGTYNLVASPDGYTREVEEIEIVPGAGEQDVIVRSSFDPFTYSWEVVPLDVGYEITLTLTYDVNAPVPSLQIPEVCWDPGTTPSTEYVYLFNPTGLPMRLDSLSFSTPGVQVTQGSLPGQIPADSLFILPVEVLQSGVLSPGQVFIDYAWQRAPDEYVTFTLNPSSKDSPLIPPGFYFETEYVIEPAVFTPGVEYTLTVVQPGELDWITLTDDPAGPMGWDPELDIALSMYAEPPAFLENGIYTDQAMIRVDGSDGTWREGFLEFEATRTNEGTYLHTTFTLGEIPTEERGGSAQGDIRMGSCSRWTWSSVPGTHRLTGRTSGTSVSFPTYGGAPTYNFDHQQVRMKISQKIMLESEAFQASLEIQNTSAAPIQDVSVEIRITDPDGLDRSAGFEFIPDIPTGLGTIPVNGGVDQEWILLPSLLGVTDPEGEDFLASAVITYTWGGQTFYTETVPELITVYPSPDLVITYQLPLPPNVCTEFPLKVTIQNRGQGPARNLRFSTSVPQVVDPGSGITIPFTISETLVNGVSVGSMLNVEVGDVPPDPEQPATIVWVLKTTVPGRFVEFTSDFRQINPAGVQLEPVISEVRTFFVPGPCGQIPDRAVSCPSGECPGIALNGAVNTVAEPINTRTGGQSFEAADFSFPTAAGPLTFNRWYASPTVEDYTELLGYGWTHSLDSRLIFPDDPLGEPGVVQLKLHSSNRLDFIEIGEGQYQAYPGVCGDLEQLEDGSFRFTDDAQNVYTFDAEGRIQSLSDPQGNQLLYVYTPEGRLDRVSDSNGDRFLQLSYDAERRIASILDHSNRQVSYAYDTAGDLVSVSDVLGQVWTYVYDDAHRMVEAIDSGGVTIERTEYDAEGRAVRQYNGAGDQVVALTYNPDGTTTITDANGNNRVDEYDERGALVDQTDPLGGSMAKAYDENFRPTELTNPAGNATALAWSEDGANLVGVEDALGNQIDLSYDGLNNLTGLVDPSGQQTAFTYEGTLLTSTTDALGNTTTYTYTPEGDLASVTDPLGNTTEYSYDSYGQRTSMTDAMGNTSSFTYDDLGRLVETTDPLGRLTRNEYDALGRLLRAIRNVNNYPTNPQNFQNQYNIITEYVYDSCCNVDAMIDSYGRRTEYDYDDAHRVTTVTDPAGNVKSNVYDEVGNLIHTIDPQGRITEYVYDAQNRLVQVTDPTGGVMTTTYDANGNMVSIVDPLGRTTTFEYDELNRQIAVIDPLGNRSETTYNANGNMASTTDAAGRTTTYAYDALNRLTGQTDAQGGVTQHVYDTIGNRVQTIDAKNHVTSFEYDALNRLVRVIDHLGNSTVYTYDDIGNRLTMTDANGNTSTFSYDALNRVIQTTDPLGSSSTTVYDALGNVLSRTDPNGNTITFDYDVLYRLLEQVDPLGGITQYTYDAVGNQVSFTDANGSTTSMVYDALNRPVSTTDPLGNTSTTTYDQVGNLTAISDALGAVTSFEYDLLNRQVRMIDPLMNVTQYAFNAVGNRIGMTDAEGVVTQYEYDGLNRLAAVIENAVAGATPDHQTNLRTEYSYDPVGNRLTITDANGNITTFEYDALNRLVAKIDPLNHEASYGYDAVGNRVLMTDALNFVTSFVYDADNRLVTIDYPTPDADVSFEYDAAGNRVRMTDGMGTTTWSYDGMYRPTQVTDPFGDTVGYAYDPVGNRTQLSYPDGKAVTYAYDALNRMVQVADWDSLLTTYSYDAASRLQTTQLPNDVVSTYDYDAAGRVLEIRHESPSEMLSSFTYSYDKVGNRTGAVETMLWPDTPQPVASLETTTGQGSAGMVFADPGMAIIGPMTLLLLVPLGRKQRAAPKLLLALVLISATFGAVAACVPAPTPTPSPTPTPPPTSTPTPTPTPTPVPDTSVISEAIQEARQLLADQIASGEVERVPGRILDRRLALAERFIEMGMEDRALQQLDIFLRTVERYRGDGVSDAAVDLLTEEVQPVVDAIEREPLQPTVFCVEEVASDWIGHFGVINPNDETVNVPVGPLNRFEPAPENREQPTSFEPGTVEDLFTVAYEDSALTWQLDGNVAIASSESPRCEGPPPEPVTTVTTINYEYDPLYRLVEANYDSGEFFHYAYDAVGNRLTQTTHQETNSYTYDAANRLTSVDGVAYAWDAKGNLLDDGTRTYTYDQANRLTSVVMDGDTFSFAYNGLGDRLQQTINGVPENYILDLVLGLTQVLDDGANSYLYGVGRIGQLGTSDWQYHLGDALSSVRLVTSATAISNLSLSFDPFGSGLYGSGFNSTGYGFTGEWEDETKLVHLRARYYNPIDARFFQSDPFAGIPTTPSSQNAYQYSYNNPLVYTDPSGENPLIGVMLIFAGIGALVVEIDQIQAHAERNNMTFLEALNDEDLYLDQGKMIDSAIHTSMIVPMVVGGFQFLMVGAADASQQVGLWFDSLGLWNVGSWCRSVAYQWGTFWWTGSLTSPYSDNVKYYNEVEFDGVKVFQNPDIDWNYVDPETGMTNLELAQGGYSPYGRDGLKIVLHHIGQRPEGPIAEVASTLHTKFYDALHWNTGQYPSLIDRGQVDTFRQEYWIWRALQILGTGE